MHQVFHRLRQHFAETENCQLGEKIGVEVETHLLDEDSGKPISLEQSCLIFRNLLEDKWKLVSQKGEMVTAVMSSTGTMCQYELGRQNLELSLPPLPPIDRNFVTVISAELNKLYAAAHRAGAVPFFGPVLETGDDLLVIPDERDAAWLRLDGREALNALAKTAAVQFTVDVSPQEAVKVLNNLNKKRDKFLTNYPQERNWGEYIKTSGAGAGYRSDRYGGPEFFKSIEDYVEKPLLHSVIVDGRLVSPEEAGEFDIDLFLRSVWWHFRLRRKKNRLCVEIRPLPRGTDENIFQSLYFVCEILEINY